jgi:dipeptidyl aminopeptidase/acylaminoacyl peptidase
VSEEKLERRVRRGVGSRWVSRALRTGCIVAIGWWVLGLAGCITGIRPDDLPTDPIAVTYWEGESARRRAELMREKKKAEPRRRGVADAESVGRLFGGPQRVQSEMQALRQYPGRLCLVDPRTGKATPLAAAPRGSVPLAWSDDHQRLLFLSNTRNRIHLYEYDRQKDVVRPITYGEDQHLYGDYGREAQVAILQMARVGERYEVRVYVTNTAGGSPRRVLEGASPEMVRLSPDGKMLLYVARPEGASRGRDEPELVLVNLEDSVERRLGPGREPSFSPLGDWIVYSAPSREGWRLRRIRADGSARSRFGPSLRDEKMPSISPDGRFVVYVGESTGLERLFVRRMDGTGDRILVDTGAVFSPVW